MTISDYYLKLIYYDSFGLPLAMTCVLLVDQASVGLVLLPFFTMKLYNCVTFVRTTKEFRLSFWIWKRKDLVIKI